MATLFVASAEGLGVAINEAPGGALPFVSLLVLFVLLFQRQVTTGSASSAPATQVSALDVGIAPLAIGAAAIMGVRLLRVLL